MTTVAFLGALLVHGVFSARRHTTLREPLTVTERYRILMLGFLGIGMPISLVSWSRSTLTANAAAIVLIVGVACLALRAERKGFLVAVCAIAGTVLLVIGRPLSTGFAPVRALYLSIVSGAVLNYRATVVALVGVVAAGVLTAHLYRRISKLGLTSEPRHLVLLLAPAPFCTALAGFATKGTKFYAFDTWLIVGGFTTLASTAATLTLIRRTTPLVGAIAALTTFLPAVAITSRAHEASFTAPMRIGAVLVVASTLALRRLIAETQARRASAGGATRSEEDR